MRVETFLYIFNIALNAAIVLLDIFLVYVTLSGKDLRRNPVMMLVLMAMLLDVCVFLNTIAHDVPSYILKKDFSTPLFTSCCGYAYFIPGHYWHFDFTKPYTYIYNAVNIVLQVACVGIMLIIDILIVYKVYKMQSAHSQVVNASIATVGHSTTSSKKILKLSPETRLALNFVALTVCFLTTTFCFNLIKKTVCGRMQP